MTVQRCFFVGIVLLLATLSVDQRPQEQRGSPSWLHPYPTSVNALYYNNRNECNSVFVAYWITFSIEKFFVHQIMTLKPTRSVGECFFYMDMEFMLYRAELSVRRQRQPVMLEFMPNYFVARIMNGSWVANETYTFTVQAQRMFQKADTGLVFRTFRHTETRVKSWYAIIKVPGMNCGKVIICVNNFVDLFDYKLAVTIPRTHYLFCNGEHLPYYNLEQPRQMTKHHCRSDRRRNPNDFQFAVGQFKSANVTTKHGRLQFISVPGVGGNFTEIMEGFWQVCQLMSQRLRKHIRSPIYRPYNVTIYMLPNFDIDRPVIKRGYCYFTPAMIIPGSTKIFNDLLHCLLHQGFMDGRQFESWNMIWGYEGMVELVVGNFTMPPYLMKRGDFSDCLDGGTDDIANLADLTTNVQDSQIFRPVRKGAGFWKMLERMNLKYARQTYPKVYRDVETTRNFDVFLSTISKHVALLNMTESWFREMLYTWTAPKGFPVLEAKVDAVKRQVCVRTYNWGQEHYIGRYVVPFKVSPKYPFYKDSETVWTHLTRPTCVGYETELYPYLINRDLSVIARILYDEENLLTWVDVLANRQTSNILTYDQKLNLVNDIFFFATNNRLDYMIALHYVQLLRSEVDERLWTLFDRMLEGLDAKARYTPIYNVFMQYIGDLMEKLYKESQTRNTTSMVAVKWSCLMNNLDCRGLTQTVVLQALLNHKEDELHFDYLCAGIRKVGWKYFRILMNSFGQPDWKEPDFYIHVLACSENVRVLRTVLLHIFYLDSWSFSASIVTDIVLTMVRMGKPGSDAVFWYLDHDPLDMLEHMTMPNFLRVVDELATYVQYTAWLERLSKRMHLKKIMDLENERTLMQVKVKIRENKRWMNRSYRRFQEHVYEQYAKYVLKSDG